MKIDTFINQLPDFVSDVKDRNNMWPSSTSYEADDGIDGSQASGGSITSSIGVIGRKNLRADAPVFKASNSDLSYTAPYDCAGADMNTSDHDSYGQEAVSEYPQM